MTPIDDNEEEDNREALLERRDKLLRLKELKQELARREYEKKRERKEREAIESFAAFVRLMWPVVEPSPLKWSWHMEVICDALQSVAEGRCKRLVINIPPGFSKSLLTSVFFPAWKWLRWPSDRSLYLSHNLELARRDSQRTREVLRSPEYQSILSRTKKVWTFARDQNETLNFQNSARGFRYCASLGAGITGKRGDNIVIDDPHDVKEATQGAPDRIAERMAELGANFDQAVRSRLNDPLTGTIIIIMQRVHEIDLTGHVLSGPGKWETLILPMRFDPERADPRDRRTVAGELLDAERFPEHVVLENETALGAQASGQYQQAPVAPGGGMFPINAWTFLDRRAFPQSYEKEAAGWDLAFGANKSGAYHAGVFGGLKRGKVYTFGEVHVRCDMAELLSHMARARKTWPDAKTWLVEDKAAGRPATEIASESIPGMILVQPSGDKTARAQAWQPYVRAGNIVLPCTCGLTTLHHHEQANALPAEPWVVEFVTELSMFPKGALKDRLDAAGYLYRELLGNKETYDIKKFNVNLRRLLGI